ncbi:MAG: outer membrane lipoprotein-sorting protein [Ignavibacteriaceae bacterium]
MIKTLVVVTLLTALTANAQDAKEIVKKADELMRSNSSYSELRMTIVKPNWSRTMGMKVWALEPDFALIYITEPARDKGTVTLKRKNEVWNWLPSAQRVIKIPPSMMLQSWMGSDFTNDDLVRQSSVVEDYNHKLIGEEELNSYNCYKIEMIPKPEAGVVWGKIITWIAKESYLQIQADYYDEDDILIKSFIGSREKKMSGRNILTYWEMIPTDKPGNKTVMEYTAIQFNYNIDKDFFSEQNMKRIR